VLCTLSICVAACADDSPATGGDSKQSGSTQSTVDPTKALGTPNRASGDPVVIGLISASASDNPLSAQFKDVEQGYAIATKYANDYRGGVGGRPIKVFVCQGGETPAGSQDCANQMVNKKVAAVVMPFTSQGSAIVPVITRAGIPYITASGASSEELTMENAFALTGGFPAFLAAYAKSAKDNGIKHFAFVVTDGPGVTSGAQALGNIVFGKEGVKFTVVPVPVGTADMSPQLQSATSTGADAVAVVGDVTFCSSFLQAYQTLGLDVTRYLIGTCIDPTVVDRYGSLLNGSYMAGSESKPEDPDTKLYAAMTTKYGKDVDPDPTVDTGVAGGVTAVMSFVNLMDGVTGTVDAAKVLDTIKTKKDVPIFLGQGTTFTCDGTAIPLLKNICSSMVGLGKLDSEGKLHDVEQIDVKPLFA
jgi:branched-chain amino acid transport system substrate-binding protein